MIGSGVCRMLIESHRSQQEFVDGLILKVSQCSFLSQGTYCWFGLSNCSCEFKISKYDSILASLGFGCTSEYSELWFSSYKSTNLTKTSKRSHIANNLKLVQLFLRCYLSELRPSG